MKKIALALILSLSAGFALAQPPVDTQNLKNEGFHREAELLESLSPAQREALLQQARRKEQDLSKMSASEREALQLQLHDINKRLEDKPIHPAQLDPAEAKSTGQIRRDLSRYQQLEEEKAQQK